MIKLKTKSDISILREGGKRHAEIMRELVAMVKPGMNTQELEDAARKLILAGGDKAAFLNYKPYGAKRPYPAALCVSVNEEVVHGIPNEEAKILKEGDIVSLDLGLVHKGLITDMAVTVGVGKISPENEHLIMVTKQALMAGIKAAKAGKKTGDIGDAVETIGIANGYGIVEDLSDHGVGYEVHEDPYVPNYGEPGKGDLLREGLVIAIEPMFSSGGKEVLLQPDGYTFITADHTPSAHFEHTVVITKSGAEVLTQ